MNGIIYMIECKINGKKYIGQTTNDIKTRWCGHLSRSKFNTETLLPCAIKELGEKNFTISQIDEGSSQHELDELERFYIEKYKTFGENGYNMTSGGDCGGKMSDIVKEKLRIKATGKHHTKETKEKLRQANLGKKQSPETIAKRRLKLIGQKRTDDTKRKMSVSQSGCKNPMYDKTPWNKGLTKDTNDIIRKQSEKVTGKNNPMYGKTPWNKGLSKIK